MEATSTTSTMMEEVCFPAMPEEALAQCCKCKRTLDPAQHPFLFPCFHPVCSPCHQACLTQTDSETHCPLCNMSCGQNELVPYTLLSVFMTMKWGEPERTPVTMCTACDEGHAAISQCTDPVCKGEDLLCEKCDEAHKRVKATKLHEIRPLSNPAAASLSHLPPPCTQHPGERVMLKCLQCCVDTCPKCQLYNHNGHPNVSLTRKADEKRQTLQADGECSKWMSEKRKTLEDLIHKYQDRQRDVKEKRNELKKNIKRSVEVIQSAITKRCEDLIRNVESATSAKSDFLKDSGQKLVELMARVEQVVQVIKMLRNCDDSQGLLQLMPHVDKQMEALKTLVDERRFKELHDPVSMDAVLDTQLVCAAISDFGYLKVDGLHYVNSPSRSHMINTEALQNSQAASYRATTQQVPSLAPNAAQFTSLHQMLGDTRTANEMTFNQTQAQPAGRYTQQDMMMMFPNMMPVSQASQSTMLPSTQQAHQQQRVRARGRGSSRGAPALRNALMQQQPRPQQIPGYIQQQQAAGVRFAPSQMQVVGERLPTVYPMLQQQQQRPIRPAPPGYGQQRFQAPQQQPTVMARPTSTTTPTPPPLHAAWQQNAVGQQIPVERFPYDQFPHQMRTMPQQQASWQDMINPTHQPVHSSPISPTGHFVYPSPVQGPNTTMPSDMYHRQRMHQQQLYQMQQRSGQLLQSAASVAPVAQPAPHFVQAQQRVSPSAQLAPVPLAAQQQKQMPAAAPDIFIAEPFPAHPQPQVQTSSPKTRSPPNILKRVAPPSQRGSASLQQSPISKVQRVDGRSRTGSGGNLSASSILDALASVTPGLRAGPAQFTSPGRNPQPTPSSEPSVIQNAATTATPVTFPTTDRPGATNDHVRGPTTVSNNQVPPLANGQNWLATGQSVGGQAGAEKETPTAVPVFNPAVREEQKAIVTPASPGFLVASGGEHPVITLDDEPILMRMQRDRTNGNPTASPFAPPDSTTVTNGLGVGKSDAAWDDYCSVCKNGGSVTCCDNCPRVFHAACHVPPIQFEDGTEDFVCGFCLDPPQEPVLFGKPVTEYPMNDDHKEICHRILLSAMCADRSVIFHHPINEERDGAPSYYKIIKQPMDFHTIREKLNPPSGKGGYEKVIEFVHDMNQVFINCAIYNEESSEIREVGRSVGEIYRDSLCRYLRRLKGQIRLEPSYEDLSESHAAGSQELANTPTAIQQQPVSPSRVKRSLHSIVEDLHLKKEKFERNPA